jgi:hypothetical protein
LLRSAKTRARSRFPKSARYPLFFLGVSIIIFGELGLVRLRPSLELEFTFGAIGLVVLVLSVALG